MNAISPERERAIRAIKALLFSASIIAAVVGGAAAYYDGAFTWANFILLTLGLFLAQAGGDYFYYYSTHFHTDARDAHTKIFAGWRPFFADSLFAGKRVLVGGMLCLALAAGIGLYFTLTIGYAILALALLGGAVAIFFTPLMLRGYKEPVIFVTFGPLSVLGAYYVLRQEFSLTPLLASLPIACFVTVVGYLKGARYALAQDRDATVVIKLNRRIISTLFASGYASLALAGLVGGLPRWTLLGLLSAPLALSVLQTVQGNRSEIHAYLWATVRAIGVLIASGTLIALGFVLGAGS